MRQIATLFAIAALGLIPTLPRSAPAQPLAGPASADLGSLCQQLDQQLRQLGRAVASEVGTDHNEGYGAFGHARNLDQRVIAFIESLQTRPDPASLRNQYQGIHQSWQEFRARLINPPLMISTPGVIQAAQVIDQLDGQILQALGMGYQAPSPYPASAPSPYGPQLDIASPALLDPGFTPAGFQPDLGQIPAGFEPLCQQLDQQLRRLGQALAAEVGTNTLETFGAFGHARDLNGSVVTLLQTLQNRPDLATVRIQYQHINQSWREFRSRLVTPPLMISSPGVVQTAQAIDQIDAQICQALGINAFLGGLPYFGQTFQQGYR